MGSPLTRLAISCVRCWTRMYTWRMPPAPGESRRAEIESDLWESQCDTARNRGPGSALDILLRLLMGAPNDLGWRVEQEAIAGRLPQESIVLCARVAGAALFICALWLIDADASRRRSIPAFARHAVALDQGIEEIMTTRTGNVSRRAKQLPLLAAGIAATVGVAMRPQLAAAPSPPIAATDPISVDASIRPKAPALAGLADRQIPPGERDRFVATDGPTFEAASVKRNRSGDVRSTLLPQPGGRLTATNVTAAQLIQFAYDLPAFQVSGGPNWLPSDRFDVAATAGSDQPLEQVRLMLRRLLAERFRLTAHTEKRELPIYALVMARKDGRMGPRLRRTDADCALAGPPSIRGIGPTPSDGPPRCSFFGFAPGTDFPSGRGGIAFRGLTMAALAKTFVPMLHRSVNDQTGLTGFFDAEFDFIAELPLPPPPPGVPSPFDAPFVSVFTVLPEQLGLKLDPQRGPVEVLVIDRAEPSTPD